MKLTQQQLAVIVMRIRDKREALHYTQTYIARRLNISQNAYSKIEAGLTNFTIQRLYEIADVLQTDVKELVKTSRQ